jgi:CRISPR/Cas system-associated exonuclease Cas4 (RecB family)
VLELDDSIEPVVHLGVALHSRPDLAFRTAGVVAAVDWKTGEPDPHDEDQVAGQLRHLEAKGVAGEKRGWLVYLREGIEREVRVSPADLEKFDARFLAGAASMQQLLADVETNTPKPIEAFAMTEDMHKCRTCRFRRLCGREQASKEAA